MFSVCNGTTKCLMQHSLQHVRSKHESEECVGVEQHCALHFCLHQMFLQFSPTHLFFFFSSHMTLTPLFSIGLLPPPLHTVMKACILLASGHVLSEDTWLHKSKYFSLADSNQIVEPLHFKQFSVISHEITNWEITKDEIFQ